MAGALAVVSLLCAGVAVAVGGGGSPSPTAAARVGTPLWSARRFPQTIVDAVGAGHLQHDLDGAVFGNDGCFSVTSDAGTIAQHAVDQPFVGASTQKLLTATAALAVLGPDTTFTTRAVSAADPVKGAVDRLVLVGGGDPTLSTAPFRSFELADPKNSGVAYTPLETLADAIVAKGVTRIGTLGVDDSRHETLRYLPVWPDSDRTDGQIGPLGALTVNRGFSAWTPKAVPVDDPAIFAGNQLAALLRARGVTVDGRVAHVKVPEKPVGLAEVTSAPVRDVVAGMIRSSDNLAAEGLVREIGLKVAKQGTTSAGTKAVLDTLAGLGVTTTGLNLLDGSGLSHEDRITCQALTAVLDLGDRPEFAAVSAGLPVAAQTGTLADEFQGSSLAGILRGKTGFLSGVTGLVGLLDTAHPVRFAFVVDGNFGETQAIRLRAQLAQVIARFPQSPGVDDLVPGPIPPIRPT